MIKKLCIQYSGAFCCCKQLLEAKLRAGKVMIGSTVKRGLWLRLHKLRVGQKIIEDCNEAGKIKCTALTKSSPFYLCPRTRTETKAILLHQQFWLKDTTLTSKEKLLPRPYQDFSSHPQLPDVHEE